MDAQIDTLILELYADEEDNDYGFDINIYSRHRTQEEVDDY